jgi:hypothetical protein
MLPFELEMFQRAVPGRIGPVKVSLPTPEDLVILKAVANRPTDMIDIEGVLDKHPETDLGRVRHWVREFAAVLESPEILQDLESLLAAREKQNRKKR